MAKLRPPTPLPFGKSKRNNTRDFWKVTSEKTRKRRVYVEMYKNGRNICEEETGACFFRGGYHPSETDGTVFPFWEMETD